MGYKEAADKVEGVNTWEDARKKLTDEELVCFLIHERHDGIVEGDEYPVTGILKIVGSKNYSISHAIHLLDMAKDLISTIGRFEF